MNFVVESINISTKKGVPKTPVNEINIGKLGLEGDAHAGHWHRQVSLLSKESVEKFNKQNDFNVKEGDFAENILISGIDFSKIGKLDRFEIGGVSLLVTQIGKKCHGDNCSIFRAVGECVMPKEGVFSKVEKTGTIKIGDKGTYFPKLFKIKIITLSDRASRGEYEDLSGEVIREQIENHYRKNSRKYLVEKIIIPDDSKTLQNALETSITEEFDIIITTGGTGVGPRDITSDVVEAFCDKILWGIMDHIRLKYGEKIPNALLSRSIAGVHNKTAVYSLPGSVKAVREYMSEILRSMDHLLEMLSGLGH